MININGPSRLTLSPDTLATVLDALAGFGPFSRVKPAFDEIFNQLKEANEHTIASGSESGAEPSNNGNSDPGSSPGAGVGSDVARPEVEHPRGRNRSVTRNRVHRAHGVVAPSNSGGSANSRRR